MPPTKIVNGHKQQDQSESSTTTPSQAKGNIKGKKVMGAMNTGLKIQNRAIQSAAGDIGKTGKAVLGAPRMVLRYGKGLANNEGSPHQARDAVIDMTADLATESLFSRSMRWGLQAAKVGSKATGWAPTILTTASDIAKEIDERSPSYDDIWKGIDESRGDPLMTQAYVTMGESKAAVQTLALLSRGLDLLKDSLSDKGKKGFNDLNSSEAVTCKWVHPFPGAPFRKCTKKKPTLEEALQEKGFDVHVKEVQREHQLSDEQTALYAYKALDTIKNYFDLSDEGQFLPKGDLPQTKETRPLKEELKLQHDDVETCAVKIHVIEEAEKLAKSDLKSVDISTAVHGVTSGLHVGAEIAMLIGEKEVGAVIHKTATGIEAGMQFAESAMELSKTVSKVATDGLSAITMGSIMGPVGCIVGAVSAIFSLFGGGSDAAQERHEELLKALETVQENILKQMKAYHEEVMNAFERVDARFDMQERLLLQHFGVVMRQNENFLLTLQEAAHNLESQCTQIRATQLEGYNRTRQKLDVVIGALPELAQMDISHILNSAQEHADSPLTIERFHDELNRVFTVANADTQRPLLTGSSINIASTENIEAHLALGQSAGAEFSAGLINKMLHSSQRDHVTNAALWFWGVEVFSKLLQGRLSQKLELERDVTLRFLKKLTAQGKDIQRMVEALSSPQTLKEVVTHYQNSFNEVKEEVDKEIARIIAENTRKKQQIMQRGLSEEQASLDVWNTNNLTLKVTTPHVDNVSEKVRKEKRASAYQSYHSLYGQSALEVVGFPHHLWYKYQYPIERMHAMRTHWFQFDGAFRSRLFNVAKIAYPEVDANSGRAADIMGELLGSILLYQQKQKGVQANASNYISFTTEWLDAYEKEFFEVNEKDIDLNRDIVKSEIDKSKAATKKNVVDRNKNHLRSEMNVNPFQDITVSNSDVERTCLIYPSQAAQSIGAQIILPLEGQKQSLAHNDAVVWKKALQAEKLEAGRIHHEYSIGVDDLVITSTFVTPEKTVKLAERVWSGWNNEVHTCYSLNERLHYSWSGGFYQKRYDLQWCKQNPEETKQQNEFRGNFPPVSLGVLKETVNDNSTKYLDKVINQSLAKQRKAFAQKIIKRAQDHGTALYAALQRLQIDYLLLTSIVDLSMPVAPTQSASLRRMILGEHVKNKNDIFDYLKSYIQKERPEATFLKGPLKHSVDQVMKNVAEFEKERSTLQHFLGRPDTDAAMAHLDKLTSVIAGSPLSKNRTRQHCQTALDNETLRAKLEASKAETGALRKEVSQLHDKMDTLTQQLQMMTELFQKTLSKASQ